MPRKKATFKPRKCEQCGRLFSPRVSTQRFCGSRTLKLGCSWKRREYRDNHRYLDPKFKKWQREYQKEWKKRQRASDTDYAERQRKLKREKSKTPYGRKVANKWRRENVDRVLEYNRKRTILKRGIEGFHTEEEWKAKKKEFAFRCVSCGDSEAELKIKWAGTNFTKLTRDHIIPIVKGGTDYIDNIQPMCVSCNASKHCKLEGGS